MTPTIRTTIKEVGQRIEYLLKRLNAKPDKRDKKEIKQELMGYGIVPLRVKDVGVSLLTDTGLCLEGFIVNGKLETGIGTIIGYYCPGCLRAVPVRDAYALFKSEPQTQCMNCNFCNSYDVMPLFSDFVVQDMGY